MSARTRKKTTAAAVKTAVPIQEAAAAVKTAVPMQEAAVAAKTAVPMQEAAAAVKQEGKRKGLCLQKARPFFAVSMACGGLVRKATGSPLSGL